jgi:3-phenylpropionate/cinnamic acid dioxygenase small subunit
MSAALQFECEQLLYEEAELLDHGHFEQWLALLAPDMSYEVRPVDVDSWYALETAATLAMRVKRLSTGSAWAEQPRVPTRRFVSNVRAQESNDEVQLRCSLLVYALQNDQPPTLLCGERNDRLIRTPQGLRFAARSVQLLGRVLQLPSLAIVL